MITFIKLLKENKTQFLKKNLKMTIFNNKIVEFSCFYILINIINHILQFAEGVLCSISIICFEEQKIAISYIHSCILRWLL